MNNTTYNSVSRETKESYMPIIVHETDIPFGLHHPCVRVKLSSMKIEGRKKGGRAHALVPRQVLSRLPVAVEGDVPDYEAQAVLLLRSNDFLSEQDMLRMTSEPEDDEINSAAANVDLGEDWDNDYREQEKCDPTDEDREFCKRATALEDLRDKRRMLMDLPQSVIKAIRENKMDVCAFSLESTEYGTLVERKTLDLHDLQNIDFSVRKRGRHSLGHGNFLTLTGKEPDGSHRWVCLVEWPGTSPKKRREKKEERGLVLAFLYEVVIRAILTKVVWIVAMFPALRRYYDETESDR